MPGVQAGVRPDQVQGLQCGFSPPLCRPQQPPAAGQHAVMHCKHELHSYALHGLLPTMMHSMNSPDCKAMGTARGSAGRHHQSIDARGITNDSMRCFTCCII